MSWIDLLRMSASNLKRRKLRTFLTVLGVVIGTASIVVMVSLGLGLQKSVYDEMEQSGGLTTINVTGSESVGDGMMHSSNSDKSDKSDEASKYIDDNCVKKFGELEHVKAAAPIYETSAICLKGKYEGYISLYASTPEGLRMRDIKLADGGTLPKSGTGKLELVYGNNVLANFRERGNNSSGYWETGELPDIDLMKDSMFMILDQDAYYNSQSSGGLQADAGTDGKGTSNVPQSAKKHIVTASGVVAGGVDDYNVNSYYVFCDLDTLKQIMKKEFNGRVIPGQPSTKSGKAYKEFYYSSAQVKVDDMSNVNDVAKQIREMGYNVETNVEAIGIANTMMMSIYERTKEIGVIKVLGCSLKNIKQMFLIEAAFIGLLGGIVGNMVSFVMSGAINMVTAQSSALGVEGNISYIPVWLVLISLGFAMLVGMVAGYFPALRAMRLSPLAAIRSE